jgi:hypothetical protein
MSEKVQHPHFPRTGWSGTLKSVGINDSERPEKYNKTEVMNTLLIY